MRKETRKAVKTRLLIKKCHSCGQMIESTVEQQKCMSCGKSFLPLNYFAKVHDHEGKTDFKDLFSNINELQEDDLVKGLYVIW